MIKLTEAEQLEFKLVFNSFNRFLTENKFNDIDVSLLIKVKNVLNELLNHYMAVGTIQGPEAYYKELEVRKAEINRLESIINLVEIYQGTDDILKEKNYSVLHNE